MFKTVFSYLTSAVVLFLVTIASAQASVRPPFDASHMAVSGSTLRAFTTDSTAYLAIPPSAFGHDLAITAQIDHGFDMINCGIESMGVVQLVLSQDSTKVDLLQPFYAERILDNHSELLP